MCARRFLFLIFFLTLIAVAGAFAIFQFGEQRADQDGDAQGPFRRRRRRSSGPDYARDRELDRAARHGRRPVALAARGRRPTGRAKPRARLLHPPDHLSRARPLERAARRPAAASDRAELFVQQPGERVQRRRRDLGAALPPGGVRRLPARQRGRARRRSTSPIATCSRAFDALPRQRRRRTGRSSSPGTARARCICRGCCASGSPASRSRGRIVAAYVVGWPISVTADLPRDWALPPATRRDQAGCILSWQSFAEPANPSLVTRRLRRVDAARPASSASATTCCASTRSPGRATARRRRRANLGTLVPTRDLVERHARARPGRRRAATTGFLLIDGAIPPLGPYVLPGNNYHVYDYALFWGAIRADAERRLAAWQPMITAPPPISRPRCPTAGSSPGSTSAPRRSASRSATPAGASPARPRPSAGPSSPPTSTRCAAFVARAARRRPRRRPAAQPRRQRQPAHPVGPRLRPQPRAARPADPAVGRALVDPGGRAGDDRRRRQPRQARRDGRQARRRPHPPGRDRRAGAICRAAIRRTRSWTCFRSIRLSDADIAAILDEGERWFAFNRQPRRNDHRLAGLTIVNAFFENSTRTLLSLRDRRQPARRAGRDDAGRA